MDKITKTIVLIQSLLWILFVAIFCFTPRIILVEGKAIEKETIVSAIVTAYNPVPEQTDEDPEIMASGRRVYEGAIACPRKWPLGKTKVEIDGRIFICEDRTAKKFDGRFDILMFSFEEALEFGKQLKEIRIIK